MVYWTRAAAAVLSVAIVVAGCGDDSVTEPEDRISTEGGTVTSADGKVSLVIPAGALVEPTAITIEPAPPSGDERLLPGTEYIFSPDGLQFAVPARLTIRFDSIPSSLADRAEWIWLHRRTAGGWTPMNGQPIDLNARVIEGQITGFSNYAGATSALAADLALAALQLNVLLNDVVANNVLAFLGTIGSILMAHNDPLFQALAEPALAAMGTTACTAFDNAVNNASGVLVDDWGLLLQLLRPVVAWHGAAASIYGPDGCPNAPLTYDVIQNRKVTEFVDFYVSRLNPASFGSNFDRLLDEVQFVLDLRGDVQLLGLSDSYALLEQRAQHPLLRELRAASYTACRSDGRHEYLGRLIGQVAASDYSADDLLNDLQMCATQLNWQLTSADQTISSSGLLGGGPAPGTERTAQSSDGIVKGTITLSGDVRAFRCPDGTFAPDELTIALNGTDIHTATATGGSFFPQPLTFDAGTVFGIAGVDPSQPGTIPLVVSRSSTGCGQYVQALLTPIPLATVNIGFPAAETDISDTWDLNVNGVCTGELTIVQTGTTFTADGSVGGPFCPFGNAAGSGNGTLDGRAIAFGLAFGSGGGGTGSVQFDGLVDPSGNTITGTFTGPASGSWTATR